MWSPDGENIAFSSTRSGQAKLYVKPANGSGEERLLSDQPGIPSIWSRDGRFLLFTTTSPKAGSDIWALSDPGTALGQSKAFPVSAAPADEFEGQLSPDNRWMAYSSNEGASGHSVYVRPFSTDGKAGVAGVRWLAGNAGRFPRWRSDGKQLFYIMGPSLGVMAVDIETSKGFQSGTRRRLFDAPPPLFPVGWSLTPPDARRFLFITTPNGGRPLPFIVVLNWAAALKK